VKLSWSLDALADRRAIYDYVDADNPRAALDLDTKISLAAQRLTKFPRLGRPGRQKGSREFVIMPSYIMVYEVHEDAIWILNIVNTRRQWPPED
jgi:addiction module RelE/StbE family toxin